MTSPGSSSGRSQGSNGLTGEMIEKQTSASWEKELSGNQSCPKREWANADSSELPVFRII